MDIFSLGKEFHYLLGGSSAKIKEKHLNFPQLAIITKKIFYDFGRL